jgi:UDP-N-acetylglucosamine 2-epimerase
MMDRATKRVLFVFGTRPEAIKMLPVVSAVRKYTRISVTVAVTGQHRGMLDQVFDAFGERPDLDFDIMSPDQTLSSVTTSVISHMQDLLQTLRPDLVLVHGDTTTAFAAATAAFYNNCLIGHVEAGYRSFDLRRPWPEEFNRVAIDLVSDLLFAPSEAARSNLLAEYGPRRKVFVTGNTGIDAVLQMRQRLLRDDEVQLALRRRYKIDPGLRLVLVTGHRRESFGRGFEQICEGLIKVAERGDVQIIYPVHLNPQVRSVVGERLRRIRNIELIDPVDYLDMIFLMDAATLIVTDSGGIQEEGPALGRPVLVMRDVTERPEAVATGVVRLTGTDPDRIRREVDLLLDDEGEYARRARQVFPYGDGTAALQIAEIVNEELC